MAMVHNNEERFCPQCGRSCVPLPGPHVSKKCADCPRTVHFVRMTAEGIKVEAGEQFTIPAGCLKISLDPAAPSKLFRSGLGFFLKQLFLAGAPRGADEMAAFARGLDDAAGEHLKNCQKIRELDLSKEADFLKAMQILNTDSSPDFHHLQKAVFASMLTKAIEDKDAARAAWAGYMSGSVHGLLLVTDPLFEETLWRGYLAGQVVHEAGVAAERSPAEAEAIKKLQPLFQRLDEATLHAWVTGGVPIGPRIGVSATPEEILKGLATFQLQEIKRKRESEQQAGRERHTVSEMKIKWLTLGVGATVAITTLLKLFGVL